MKTFSKAFAVLALLFAPLSAFAQQNFLGQTTLAAAVQGQYLGSVSGANVPAPTLIQVTSATSIVGITPNLQITASQPNQTYLLIGREQMRVTAVNGTALTVVRGVNGTVAVPHPGGDMVLFGPPRFFYVMDPGGIANTSGGISGVTCTQANVVVSPWVNVRSGGQWLCSSVTGTWVPGWNNSGQDNLAATSAVVSAAPTTTPSGPLFTMSGTAAIVNFATPLGFNATASGGGCFTAIPTGIWTWTAAGNIAVAGTVTAGNSVPVTFCWNAATSKWIPNRIS
jgi:hypothetical protein